MVSTGLKFLVGWGFQGMKRINRFDTGKGFLNFVGRNLGRVGERACWKRNLSGPSGYLPLQRRLLARCGLQLGSALICRAFFSADIGWFPGSFADFALKLVSQRSRIGSRLVLAVMALKKQLI